MKYFPVRDSGRYHLAMFIFLATAIILSCMPAWAGTAGKRQTPVNQEEGRQPPLPLPKEQVTIEKKSLAYIYTYGPKFAVNKETLIVGVDGKEVSIKKMRVPCDAEVRYATENGIRTAKRIDIKRVAEGANDLLISEYPQ